jgi:hypothetical protein
MAGGRFWKTLKNQGRVDSTACSKGLNCFYFDAGSVTETSKIEGVHLNEDQHQKLRQAPIKEIKLILRLKNT